MSDSVTKFYENDEFQKNLAKAGAKNFPLMVGDPTVKKVVDQFKHRSALGIKKYGTTLAENDLSLIQWLEHAKEEAMDNVLYLQRAIDELHARENSI